MSHSNKTLVSILIVSLFTLVILQGISILKRQSGVLGESIGTTKANYVAKCLSLGGNCKNNCASSEKPIPGTDCATLQCCVTFSFPTPKITDTPFSTGLTSLCGEIDRLQKLYCSGNSGSVKATATATPGICNNGSRRCSGNTVQICLNSNWQSGENCPQSCLNGRCLTALPTSAVRPSIHIVR